MATIDIQNSRDSLKDYVRSIGAPGRTNSNFFGLGSWLSGGPRSHGGEQSASLLENEDNFDAPTSNSGSTSGGSALWSSGSSFFGLTKRQRMFGFILCLSAGGVCFTLAFVFLPFIAVKARKFVVLFTLGSVFSIGSFSMIWGPWQHIRHLLSRPRLPFTLSYTLSLVATLYSALHLVSTPLTVLCALIQLLTLFWFVVSYLPGGQRGAQLFASVCQSMVKQTVTRTLPV